MKERQRQQQRAESQADNTPIDPRTILNTNKRAREPANANRNPNPSPTQQPEARRVRLRGQLLSTSEAQQLDITARDALRLQREKPATAEQTDTDLLRFETVTSKGDPENVGTLKRATIGAHYIRPVKRATKSLSAVV